MKGKGIKLMAVCLAIGWNTPTLAQDYRQLAGTWKMENKEIYEVWALEKDLLTGCSYRMQDGEKRVTEELQISKAGDVIIYRATVLNQNQGQPVAFVLNNEYEDRLQFENPSHDFPKKIIYRFESPDRIHVSVLGENDEGFDYYMNKVGKH